MAPALMASGLASKYAPALPEPEKVSFFPAFSELQKKVVIIMHQNRISVIHSNDDSHIYAYSEEMQFTL